MNIHEYQAKQLLREYGVPVPRGVLVRRLEEVDAATRALGSPPWVMKAQIHAGGRGKGGGIKVVHTPQEAQAAAQALLGNALITPQTGPQGRVVRLLYLEEGLDIKREVYLSLLVDRAHGCVSFVASKEGGMDIEEVARSSPEAVCTVGVDPVGGAQPFHGRKLAQILGLSGGAAQQIGTQISILASTLYKAFTTCDMSLLEINPLVFTAQDNLVCLDAKVAFDDNGLFRHKRFLAWRDIEEEDPKEAEAATHGLSYIRIGGDIACMVNGAGLAMATMDIIQLHGASPANFLDVGGGASREKVTQAFRMILEEEGVRAILVNIFGGIMRCDVIAEGIVAAVQETRLALPLVVRFAGTHAQQGRQILEESSLPIIAATSLEEAAQKAVGAARH